MVIEKKIKTNRGFTLIELMLSMAIVAFLSSIMFQMARQSDTKGSLIVSRDRFRSAIRSAQSFALTGLRGTDVSGAHVCGFGMVVTGNNSYKIFYNPAGNITDCGNANYSRYSAASQDLPAYSFTTEQGTVFDAADVGDSVFFKVPYGDVCNASGIKLVGASGYGSDVQFRIQKTDGSVVDLTTVTPYGRIE